MTFSLLPTYEDDPALAELVTRLREYLDGELAEYEEGLGLGPESVLDRSMLEPVWRRSRELGFYGVHLPEHLGGRGLSFTQLAALKEEVGASERELSTSVLGAARRAIQLSIGYAANRTVFDGPLLEKQAIQHKVADMVTDYYAARAMTYDALAALDAGARPRIESFMCKLFVAERAFEIADAAVQIHGKAGMVRGAPHGGDLAQAADVPCPHRRVRGPAQRDHA